jgi:hypothetical protein
VTHLTYYGYERGIKAYRIGILVCNCRWLFKIKHDAIPFLPESGFEMIEVEDLLVNTS